MSDWLVLGPLLGFSPINPKPFTFPYISFEIQVLQINFTQLSYKSFLCRTNGSELKLCPKVAEINFSYFVKTPQWLEMVGRKISQHAKG